MLQMSISFVDVSVYYLETSGELDELETIKMIYGWYQGSIRVK